MHCKSIELTHKRKSRKTTAHQQNLDKNITIKKLHQPKKLTHNPNHCKTTVNEINLGPL